MPAGIYSAKNSIMVIGGIPVTGLADDNAYTLAMANDGYTPTEGIDGFVTYSENGGSLMTVTIRLMYTSWYNEVLQRMYNLQRTSPATAFRTFLFKDVLGTLKVNAEQCLIIKPADISTSKDVPIREWTVSVSNPLITGGGSIVSPFAII